MRAADTFSVVWRYKIDTTIINDTARRITEEGERLEQGRRLVYIDSVTIVRRDTLDARRITPHVAPREQEERKRPAASLWIAGAVALALLLFSAGWVIRQVKR